MVQRELLSNKIYENKYATWYYSYRCTNPITLISTSGNHYEYFTINNLLKFIELKYYF